MEEYKGRFEWIDTDKVVVDHRYQRDVKPALVAAIASDPRWELFGVPILFARNSTGQFYVADGQQRIAGVKQSKNPPTQIPAVVFPVEGLDEEAAVFVQINEFRKGLTSFEKHKGRIVAKDPSTMAIERVLETLDLSAGTQGGQSGRGRTITAVGTLYSVYEQLGEEGLMQVLVVARDAWENDSGAFSAPVLRGLAQTIMDQGENYDRQKLTKALSRVTPMQITRKADELMIDVGGGKRANVRRAIRQLTKQ